MIDPHAIPQFKGDLEQLEKDAAALKKQAGKFRTTGADVHSKFQSLSGAYHAPEAQQLFDTTIPVRDMSDDFAGDLEKIATALTDYADEVRPIRDKLKRLKHQAAAFVEKVKGDEHWKDDEKKIAEHADLLHEVNAAVAAFQAAERRAANKIGTRFFGSTHYRADDGSGKKGMYGYRAGDLDKAKNLPWGSPEEETHRVWELDHWGAKAVKGFVVDGFGGDIDGVLTLFGKHGGDKASQAWGQLWGTFGGIGEYTIWPYDWAMSKAFGGGNGDTAHKKALRDALKGFVAWDEWDKDPVRAGGQVLYNVTPFGLAGKLGKAAKGTHLAEVTKAAKVADSFVEGTRAARAALPKASEVLAAVKHLPHWGDAPRLDHALDAADDLAHTPSTGVRLPDQAGRPPMKFEADGSLRHAETGEPIQTIDQVRKETEHPQQSLPDDHSAHERAPEREKVAVGAEHEPPRAHAHSGDGPSARHEPSTAGHSSSPGAGGHSTPSAGGHGDGPSAGHGGSPDVGGHHGPSTGGRGESPTGGHSDGHTGGHDGPPAGGHHDGPDVPAHDGADGGHHGGPDAEGSSEGGADGGSHAPSDFSDRVSEGDRTSQQPSAPMSPAQEVAVTDALKRAKMPPQDLERALVQLRKSEYGASVAEYITQGKFDNLPGYYGKDGLLFQCKQKGMIPAVHQAMEFAAELQKRGVDDLGFEYKAPGQGLDLDVLVKSGDDIKYGAQLKDVDHEGGIGSAAKKIAKKGLGGEISGPKVAILDVHDTRAALTEATVKEVEHFAKRTGATFELRFDDGSVTIPPNGQIYP
ncbi:hypothetical protein [Streptomyces violens]|uniref:hypothetical protein n=1 Tax=Streptomyces violens TaxID=66377 RepID=UPI0004C2434A|nr:hypothetical protein [Streptomyces violens]